ncbi:MAG: thioredoxin family protein, partial [Planctomycetota bacterium]
MRRLWIPLVLLAMLPGTAFAQEAEKPQKKDLYDEDADATQQIAEAVAKAGRDERRVLIQWGADWCGWCHLLSGTFEKDPKVRQKLLYEYEHIHVDVDRKEHLEVAEKYGAKFKDDGVPYLTILDSKGDVVTNAETAQFEVKEEGVSAHDPALLLDFLTKHQAKYPKAQALLDKALADAKESNRRVFLTFGAPWCGWCHRLEDWMYSAPVHDLLGKDFVLLKIDTERTEGGQAMLDEMRQGASGGIPWFVFLEPDGTVVTNSNGPNGNLGCP